MLTMTQVHDIRKKYFEEGKTISQISKELGFDRKTVRGYLKKDDFNSPPVPQSQLKFQSLRSRKFQTPGQKNYPLSPPLSLRSFLL
jgi:hypothetical protein